MQTSEKDVGMADNGRSRYCRTCHYDLRGQETARCPECGREYDPDDPRTFLQTTNRLHRIRLTLVRNRHPVAVVILTIGWAYLMVLGPGAWRGRRHSDGSPRAVTYIKMITIQRIVWQKHDPEKGDFDRQAAVRDLPPLFSPYSENTKTMWLGRLNRARTDAPYYAILTAIYAALLVPLLPRRRRRLSLGVVGLCFASLLGTECAWRVVRPIFPPGHAYLDDYVYINEVDVAPWDGTPSTTIAAYDWRSFHGDGPRLIAFTDGHAERLGDDEARPLFEAQGLEYPVDAKDREDE